MQNRGLKIAPWAVLVWLAVWQLAAMAIGHNLILVTPLAVLTRLAELALQTSFWLTIATSFLRVISGFLLATVLGIALAFAAAHSRIVEQLIAPPLLFIKTTPVAAFIILLLVWISSADLPIATSFLVVLPITFVNILEGLRATDPKLLELAQVFALPRSRRLRFISIPQLIPYFRAACSITLGMCWKAGIAAEVISNPSGSIGEQLYMAKLYLATTDLFAWVLVIMLISFLFEKAFLKCLELTINAFEQPKRLRGFSSTRGQSLDSSPNSPKSTVSASSDVQDKTAAKLCEKDCHPGQDLASANQDLARTPSSPGSSDEVAGSLRLLDDDLPVKTGQNRLFAQSGGPGFICIDNISINFGQNKVLENLNIQLPLGQTSCLLAPSGSGKTTLLNILMGLQTANIGSITGMEGKTLSAVFQEDRLCEELSAVTNVLICAQQDVDLKTACSTLHSLGMQGHTDKPVRELSGGMRRRVVLARALLAKYDILVLDEPFKGLDDALRASVITQVKARAEGKTVIMVTHDIREAKAMDAQIFEI